MLYTSALDENRLKIYHKLKEFSGDFVLSGGTALMLQINHRKSFDFDLFTNKPIDKSLLRKCREIFGRFINVNIDNSDLLLFNTSSGVKIDMVYYPYKPLFPLIKADPLPLFDINDLASNKAYTIGRRATWRDYVDLFFLLRKNHTNLDKIISDAKKRFSGEFSEKLFLEQLSYFKDLEVVDIEFIKEKYTEKEIKKFLTEQVEKYTTKALANHPKI